MVTYSGAYRRRSSRAAGANRITNESVRQRDFFLEDLAPFTRLAGV